ncbi:MAG: hypothetical protein AAF694_06660 [Bacteroidota bacterium]
MASDFELATWQKISILEDNFILLVDEREIASVKFSPFYQKLAGASHAFISFDQFRFEVISGKTWLKQFNIIDHENAIVAHTKSTVSGYCIFFGDGSYYCLKSMKESIKEFHWYDPEGKKIMTLRPQPGISIRRDYYVLGYEQLESAVVEVVLAAFGLFMIVKLSEEI